MPIKRQRKQQHKSRKGKRTTKKKARHSKRTSESQTQQTQKLKSQKAKKGRWREKTIVEQIAFLITQSLPKLGMEMDTSSKHLGALHCTWRGKLTKCYNSALGGNQCNRSGKPSEKYLDSSLEIACSPFMLLTSY